MRPQQNRRMRGRGNNNRKGPNPLTRSYESNGPDVKIRGTAQQVAEKYTTLARDAQSSGDRVMAENYLQHAEHYNRVIAAAQAQNPTQQQHRPREDDEDEDERDYVAARQEQPTSRQEGERQHAASDEPGNGSGPQPDIEGTPAEIALQDEQPTTRRRSRGAKQVNGAEAHEAEAQQAEAAPEAEQPAKRPRRPRKTTRAKTGSGETDGAQGEIEGLAEAGEVAEAAARG